MKILIVSQYYYPERFSVTNIAEALVEQGHDVSVLTGKPNYGYQHILKEYKHVRYEEINGVKINRVNLAPRKNTRVSIIRNYLSFHNNAKRFAKHLKEKFDVVLAMSLSPVISVSPALAYSKKNHVPCVLYCMDLWPESPVVTGAVKRDSLVYKMLFKWSKSIYQRCDRILISSPSFKSYFEKELGITNKGFKVVSQPIIISNSKEEPVVYKNKYNIVYAGNIGKLQLTDLLVDAMNYVETKDVKLHFMGTGSSLKLIQKKIVESNLSANVDYLGVFPIEKAEAYFVNADALIVSLKNDGYVGSTIPNKAVQFLKYGKPILGVVSGDAKTMLENAKGTVFAGENAENIAESIDKICAMSDKEKALFGVNNKAYFEKYLSIEKLSYLIVEELMDVKK